MLKLFKKSNKKNIFSKDPNIIDLEKSVADKIGVSVLIKNSKVNKGTITFSYQDLNQLNKIIEIIKKYY